MQLKNYSLAIGKKKLFSNVSINFESGTVCNILGGNGVGKSSFAKSLIGMLDYDGQVIYQGSLCVIGSYTNVPYDLTISDLIKILKRSKAISEINELYDLLGIKEIDHFLKIGKMSDGQKQKIKLLSFLSSNPDIIILDEFTASLDKKSMLDIYNFLQTYLPEKKYGIVDELEKKTVVHQSTDMIENGRLLKVDIRSEATPAEQIELQETNAMESFKLKVEKLKIMKDAGLLSDEKFAEEQAKLLNMI